MPIENEIHEKLVTLLDERKYSEFMREIDEFNPVDAAEFLTLLESERLPAVFRLLKKDTAADVFVELDVELQEEIVKAMTDRELSRIIEDLFVDDAVDMLEEMPANVVKRIMKNASPETRQMINKFLNYSEDSAGSVMTAEYIAVRANMTVSQSLEYIRRTGVDKETVYIVYVTNTRRVLEGTFELKELIFASPDTLIEEIMESDPVSVTTTDDREAVASLISKYDLLALPVVDKENRLVGIVTVDDALDVIEEETTEDIEKMAAILPNDKPYMRTGIFETWKKRIPWLLLLMISATFTSTIITFYESAISASGLIILTAFMPMLMDTGGNAGGQASVTVIRSLSLGDIQLGDFLKILWKEFRVSLLCSATMAIATFAKVMLVDRMYTYENGLMIALVVSLTLGCAIIVAKVVGSMLPILAKRIGLDPAVMASPFITTIVDALTLVIYFQLISRILNVY